MSAGTLHHSETASAAEPAVPADLLALTREVATEAIDRIGDGHHEHSPTVAEAQCRTCIGNREIRDRLRATLEHPSQGNEGATWA